MAIEDYIPHWRIRNAIGRLTLSALAGTSDRITRREINEARKRGIIICNDQDGRGYYIPTNIDDVARQYRQNESRAMDILVQQKHLRRILKEAGKDV